jgi:hypothetical protein
MVNLFGSRPIDRTDRQRLTQHLEIVPCMAQLLAGNNSPSKPALGHFPLNHRPPLFVLLTTKSPCHSKSRHFLFSLSHPIRIRGRRWWLPCPHRGSASGGRAGTSSSTGGHAGASSPTGGSVGAPSPTRSVACPTRTALGGVSCIPGGETPGSRRGPSPATTASSLPAAAAAVLHHQRLSSPPPTVADPLPHMCLAAVACLCLPLARHRGHVAGTEGMPGDQLAIALARQLQ